MQLIFVKGYTEMYEKEISKICQNINTRGLYRYDPRDLMEIADKMSKGEGRYYNLLRRMAKGMELFAPKLIRKCFRIAPTLYPTTFTFLAEACFWTYQRNEKLPLNYSDINLMEKCIETYNGRNGNWSQKENLHFFIKKDDKKKEPSMNLYLLTRCNNLLLRLGKYYEKEEYIKISVAALKRMLANHNLFQYENGARSISYHYNSDDCTINVNTEVADWISKIPEEYMDEGIQEVFRGLIKLAISEQNPDGSWYYYSKEHIKRLGSEAWVDCHHTATVLYNLIHVINSSRLDDESRKVVLESVTRGMKFYLNAFFDKKTGKGKTQIGKLRKASAMQYSEALVAMCEFVACEAIEDYELKNNCKEMRDLIARQLVRLVRRDGSVPGDGLIYPINLDSINWGNGGALWALVRYRNSIGEENGEEKTEQR